MFTKSVGEFSVTAVSDGRLSSNHDILLGIDRAEVVRLTGVPDGQPVILDVNCFLIRHNGKVMLSDAGTGHQYGPTLGHLPNNLRAASIAPEQVDAILLTHMHPDHAWGLLDEAGKAVYPKAEVVVHEAEAAFWIDRGPQPNDPEKMVRNINMQRGVAAAYAGRVRRIKDGEMMPGITAVMRAGHSPGHTNFLLQSGGERLLLWGDIVHLASVQIPRPDCHLIFDYNGEQARQSRQQAFDWAVREGVTVAGAHLPYPGFASLSRQGAGYSFTAV